ncbi:MAG: hypothetical protein R3350_09320 [Saprospiraceae bacterium]|nr:hypothetical protein [Saprospiraceae bacterium]
MAGTHPAAWSESRNESWSFGDFFEKNCPQPQLFDLDAGRRMTLRGTGGTCLIIPPRAFTYPSGSSVEGRISVSLRELFHPGQFVCSGHHTTSRGNVLESPAQVELSARQNDLPLNWEKTADLWLPVRARSDNLLATRLFQSSGSTTVSLFQQQFFDWQILKAFRPALKVSGGQKFLAFKMAGNGWYACLSPFHFRRKKKGLISLKAVSPYGNYDQAVAFMVFHRLRSVVSMLPSLHTFTAFNIPLAEKATAIIMAVRDGRLFYGQRMVENTSRGLIRVEIREMEEASITRSLLSLRQSYERR